MNKVRTRELWEDWWPDIVHGRSIHLTEEQWEACYMRFSNLEIVNDRNPGEYGRIKSPCHLCEDYQEAGCAGCPIGDFADPPNGPDRQVGCSVILDALLAQKHPGSTISVNEVDITLYSYKDTRSLVEIRDFLLSFREEFEA